jgi:lipid-A-disaccharide synthase
VRILLSAGEVSGDIAAARLAQKLLELDPDAELFGLGGARMAAAGVHLDAAADHLGTVGVTEALAAVPSLWRAVAGVRRRLRTSRPDVAVLIGNDVFNTLLARWLRSRRVPTVSYFPPQVWVWRAMAPFIARSFDAILTSFPEEHAVYEKAGVGCGTTVSFVGHYLADTLRPPTPDERLACRRRLDLPDEAPVVALLPGSRTQEVRTLCGVLLDSAGLLLARAGDLAFVVPVVEASHRAHVEAEAARRGLAGWIRFTNDSHAAMRAADLAILASGTASLEAALLGVPMVIVYRVSALTFLVLRTVIAVGLIESGTVGLPNLILRRPAVPEFAQSPATADAIAGEAWSLLVDTGRRETTLAALREVAGRVTRPGSLEAVARAVVALAEGRARSAAAAATTAQGALVGDRSSGAKEMEARP